jgi:hypothetical protein
VGLLTANAGSSLLNVFDAAGGAKLPTDFNNAKLWVMVVPGDKRGGCYVSTVKSIELRDPGPARSN